MTLLGKYLQQLQLLMITTWLFQKEYGYQKEALNTLHIRITLLPEIVAGRKSREVANFFRGKTELKVAAGIKCRETIIF